MKEYIGPVIEGNFPNPVACAIHGLRLEAGYESEMTLYYDENRDGVMDLADVILKLREAVGKIVEIEKTGQ
ncbi:hypothetical protein QUF80_17020 [Desulfococcaceae bacterium HSG8]|nr:hypothetical protein [Desulfococcaceae bacterium HSG8]